jgi:hypothetical protein
MMQVDLTSDERRLILVAITHPIFKAAIQEPATPRQVRLVYRSLLEKMKRDEQLHMDLEQSVGGGKLILPK